MRANARHHPPAAAFDVESRAIAGRVHAVVMRRRNRASRFSFVDDVERRLGGAAELAKAPAGDHLAQPRLAGLRPQREPDLLRLGGRGAEQRRGRVIDAPDRVQIIFDLVTGERLDDHPGAVGRERLADVRRRPARVAHIVQAVEEGHEVVAAAGIVFRAGDLELHAVGDSRLLRPLARHLDRAVVVVVPDEGGGGVSLGHQDG